MILLADQILDGGSDQESFGGIDAQVRRNAFGRQVDSFETDLSFTGISGAAFRAVFIRAPWVESVGDRVEVLASFQGHPVAIRQGHLLATSFHPELTGDNRIHRFFVDQLCNESLKARI
jgi:5'-phosphate synthase pdxT subunit